MADRLDLDVMRKRLHRGHLTVDDCWYNCPLSPDGCCDDSKPLACDCGAVAANELLDVLCDEVERLRRVEDDARRVLAVRDVRYLGGALCDLQDALDGD